MKTLFLLTSVMVGLFLAAPNQVAAQKRKAATPLEATVNATLKQRVTMESRGALLLASFHKTNGYEKGYGIYVIEWQAAISVLQDIWKGGNAFVGYFQDFRVMAREPGSLDSIGQNPKHLIKGTTIRLAGDATLRKTEQGWRIEGMSVKTAQVIETPIGNAVSKSPSQPYVAPKPSSTSGDLSFKTPDTWVAEKPSSAMRAAQYKLPKAEGDREDASLVLYYFGATQGGSAQANIDRWISQIQQADGSSSKDKAKTETVTVNGLKVTTVDVAGTYTAEMAPGSGTSHNDADYRLRAAVVETPKGNYFVKLVGPAKTVGRWEQAYADYLKSFEFK